MDNSKDLISKLEKKFEVQAKQHQPLPIGNKKLDLACKRAVVGGKIGTYYQVKWFVRGF
jgi:hypothetical protein